MLIKQFYTNCLAEASYVLISNGEAAIVDPIRDTKMYLDFLAEHRARLKYVLETHFHADFVSGHVELAEKTGASIVYGPGAKAEYAIHVAENHEKLNVGQVQIEVLHTPGHTPESVCYLAYNENGTPESVFTGDTLFVGDVGRPDLLEGLIASTQEQVHNLYRTIQDVIKKLPENLTVYPGHGPGSMCGKSIGKETETTIAKELASNYALQELTEAEFQEVVLSDQLPAPWYFQQNALKNRTRYTLLDQVLSKAVAGLSPQELASHLQEGGLVLDVRKPDEYAKGHIPGSLNVGLDGSFAIWVGTLIHDLNSPIVLVVDGERATEAVTRLARVGYENIRGYLKGGVSTWIQAGYTVESVAELGPEEFAGKIDSLTGKILDVRGLGERKAGFLAGSESLPLRDFPEKASLLDKNTTWYIHCAGGYRSMVAASWLQKLGFEKVVNVRGGYNEIRKFVGEPSEA